MVTIALCLTQENERGKGKREREGVRYRERVRDRERDINIYTDHMYIISTCREEVERMVSLPTPYRLPHPP